MEYLAIYLLNIADYAITVYWTNLHGIQTEINPLMRMALGMFIVVILMNIRTICGV